MMCTVCGVCTKRYKCPKCLEPYCSLLCYKDHQIKECKSTQLAEESLLNITEFVEPTLHEPFSSEDTVSWSKMEFLKSSKVLRNLLSNVHLRNLLTEIDVAPDAWKAMKAAMQEPIFLEFADECLKIIEPQ